MTTSTITSPRSNETLNPAPGDEALTPATNDEGLTPASSNEGLTPATCKIERLIPQRKPFMMVDRLLEYEEGSAVTAFAVGRDNYFVADGELAIVALVENMAQSASAMAGYKALLEGAEEPPQGILAEVKKFQCHRQPRIGETLTTQVKKGVEVNGVAIVYAKTHVGDELVAETQMKIYVPKQQA